MTEDGRRSSPFLFTRSVSSLSTVFTSLAIDHDETRGSWFPHARMYFSMYVDVCAHVPVLCTQDGGKTIDGSMQLYSMELKKQQQLEGHAACFNNIVIDETVGPQPVICFTEKKRDSSEFKLHIRDIYSSREGSQTPPLRRRFLVSLFQAVRGSQFF